MDTPQGRAENGCSECRDIHEIEIQALRHVGEGGGDQPAIQVGV